MRRDIVFVHIPKTAGTSTRVLLESVAPRHLLLRDYGNDPATTPALYELIHVQKRATEFRHHFSQKNDGILLSGHFPASRYWDFFNAESFVTFLRDPVERVISEYAHFVNHKGWTGSFEEFVVRPGGRNVISNFLEGVDLDRFGFIGFVDEFEVSVSVLSRFIGVNLAMRNVNVGDYSSIDQKILMDEKYRSMITDCNQRDIALYDQLRKRRRDNPCVIGADAAMNADYRGRVQLMPNGMAVGWLCNLALEFIADVEVLRDGQHASLIKADIYREDRKNRGGSRSGVCGFRVNLQDLPSSGISRATPEKIGFRARGSDYELKGSPILFERADLTIRPPQTLQPSAKPPDAGSARS